MIPLDYAALRLARRLMPERAVAWLRSRRTFIEPGLETREPELAVERYAEHLERFGFALQNKRVMVLGYGGSFGVGVELLRRGARHVTLVDPFVAPEDHKNERYLAEAPEYVRKEEGEIRPDPEQMTVIGEDACELAAGGEVVFDLILSSSVLEHVTGLERLVGCLRQLTADGGAGLHIVDLRDHFFKYPFEMLCHSREVWQRLLEPPTRLNRARLWDYDAAFEANFAEVGFEILESDPESLAWVEHRVRPEFLSGDRTKDAATKIALFCSA